VFVVVLELGEVGRDCMEVDFWEWVIGEDGEEGMKMEGSELRLLRAGSDILSESGNPIGILPDGRVEGC